MSKIGRALSGALIPTTFPAEDAPHIRDRTVVDCIESGVLQGMGNTRVLLDAFFDQGVRHCIVPAVRRARMADASDDEIVTHATHWWLLLMGSGMKVVYFGTPASFQRFQNDGARGNLFEFGKGGKVLQ
jgi:hypothetical protein